MNINDIFIDLAREGLCFEAIPVIAGQDTNFEELQCRILDEWGNILLAFDYQLDHKLHGGNVAIFSSLNPHGWYEEITSIDQILKHLLIVNPGFGNEKN